ncbi:hypothetical protein, partial [Cytobacillus oceanisediminis]|uniref:hypothetical protein n=1 Tax=Cytobacillus oceanisediminis TaxID=665099 RepID=UPI0011A1E25B
MMMKRKEWKGGKMMDVFLSFLGWVFVMLLLYKLSCEFEGKVDLSFVELNLENGNWILLLRLVVGMRSGGWLSWWSSYNR